MVAHGFTTAVILPCICETISLLLQQFPVGVALRKKSRSTSWDAALGFSLTFGKNLTSACFRPQLICQFRSLMLRTRKAKLSGNLE